MKLVKNRVYCFGLLTFFLILSAQSCKQDLNIDSALFACHANDPTSCGDGYTCLPNNSSTTGSACIPLSQATDTSGTTTTDTADINTNDIETRDISSDTQDAVQTCTRCDNGKVCAQSGECVPPLISVSAGESHSCALRATGELTCWGNNNQKQAHPTKIPNPIYPPGVPDNTIDGTFMVPDDVLNHDTFCAGRSHTCAILQSGEVACWGERGAVGADPDADAKMAYPVVGDQPLYASAIACGSTHTCAISSSGNEVFCWGNNNFGQAGFPPLTSSDEALLGPIKVDGLPDTLSFKSIAAGEKHTCVLAESASDNPPLSIYCWGKNDFGQLTGPISAQEIFGPQALAPGSFSDTQRIDFITAGANHTCAKVTNDNLQSFAYCWGLNSVGQVGNGSLLNMSSPVPVWRSGAPMEGVILLSAGGNHTCASTIDRTLCWGDNARKQLGNNEQFSNQASISSLQQVPLRLGLGARHTCAVLEVEDGGTVYCWGDNDERQLGVEDLAPSGAAQAVDNLP